MSATSAASSVSMDTISLPPRIAKRGRPKGAETTVIGLPRKKRQPQQSQTVPFEKMSSSEQVAMILCCFVDSEQARKAVDSQVTTQDLLKSDPREVAKKCTDKRVDLNRIHDVHVYFSPEAWSKVQCLIAGVRKLEWLCNSSTKHVADSSSIGAWSGTRRVSRAAKPAAIVLSRSRPKKSGLAEFKPSRKIWLSRRKKSGLNAA